MSSYLDLPKAPEDEAKKTQSPEAEGLGDELFMFMHWGGEGEEDEKRDSLKGRKLQEKQAGM